MKLWIAIVAVFAAALLVGAVGVSLTYAQVNCGNADTACWERAGRAVDARLSQQVETLDRQQRIDAAMKDCAATSGAEAYQIAPSQVRSFGTNRVQFDFERCMAARGFPLAERK